MPEAPLFLPGWLAFNQRTSGFTPVVTRYTRDGKELPCVEAVLYIDDRGRAALPPANPYIAVAFKTTPTKQAARLYRQWVDVGDQLVADLRARGLRHPLPLPPEIGDVRSWQWQGFNADVRYTFLLDFPLDHSKLDHSKRGNINRATGQGFVCSRTERVDEVLACLDETEARQGFDHGLRKGDLALAQTLLGSEHMRSYVVHDTNGEVAAAAVVLHSPGHYAIAWLKGTKDAYIRGDATPLLDAFIFEDLTQAGAIGLDLAGANLVGVANYKAQLGARLVPFYKIGQPDLKGLALSAAALWRWRQRPRQVAPV